MHNHCSCSRWDQAGRDGRTGFGLALRDGFCHRNIVRDLPRAMCELWWNVGLLWWNVGLLWWNVGLPTCGMLENMIYDPCVTITFVML